MKKVKLPRKRKKAFIKGKSRSDYLTAIIMGELLVELGLKHGGRFYSHEHCKTTKEHINGIKIKKRW